MKIESSDTIPFGLIIDSHGRALTESVTSTGLKDASNEGNAFFATSDFISLTTVDTETGIFFLQNTSNELNITIERIRTCGESSNKWKLYKNPTTGTLISVAAAGSTSNLNFTSGTGFQGDVFVGVDGSTLTDGSLMGQWINGGGGGHSTDELNGAIILGTNDSIALTVEVGVASDVCANILLSFNDSDHHG